MASNCTARQRSGFRETENRVAMMRIVQGYAIAQATAGAFLLAGFVKGVIGMGLPTVSIGLLGLR
jgi:hypothetical protein